MNPLQCEQELPADSTCKVKIEEQKEEVPIKHEQVQPLESEEPAPSEPNMGSITTFEEIQKQLKSTLDHIEQKNMVSGFQTLSKATTAVVDNCEQLGIFFLLNKG